MSIEVLTAISNYYGSKPEYVIAGGGNTSFKDPSTLYIKGSGIALADCSPESFVRMDRHALARIWTKTYPADAGEREKAVLADLMDARQAGENHKRPSVETLLHDMLPFSWVIHTHPAIVNGLTCSRQGEQAVHRLFPGEAVWIPSTNPGYILAQRVKQEMEVYQACRGRPPGLIFLQNHGVFVSADTPEGIHELYRHSMEKLSGVIGRKPEVSESAAQWGCSSLLIPLLSELTGGTAVFARNHEIARFTSCRESFAPAASAFTPDQIVYAGGHPLFVETAAHRPEQILADIRGTWDIHRAETGGNPKIIGVQGLGVFGLGSSEKAAALALELFIDGISIAVYAESFGGPQSMPLDQIQFINTWEAERYRSQISSKTSEF
jgi:rhamnose utilization protein RhaD (predicted bifunctional aldolase and dehydrogenase)